MRVCSCLPGKKRCINMIPKVEKILDFSQEIYHACPAWPTYDCVIVDYEARHVTHDFVAEKITMDAHTATHIDAPYHFREDGLRIDELDPMLFQGRGVAFDLTKVKDYSKYEDIRDRGVTVEDLKACNVELKKDDIALIYTGWAQKRAETKEYMYGWPYLTREASQWLVDSGVKAVGVDGLSVGGWGEGCGVPAHEVLLNNNILVIEELYMDQELFEEPEWYVVALPIKLKGFGGAPTRVVAIKFAEE